MLKATSRLADQQVARALEQLSADYQQTVVDGLRLYAAALSKSRRQSSYSIRPIKKQDNPRVARLIREVMTEFHAVGAGYSISDSEVDDMFSSYRQRRSCYFVIAQKEEIVGAGGIAPLTGGDKSTCELRKTFFFPQIRGLGLGRRLLSLLLDEARLRGFKQCYLETLDRMWRAIELYRKAGFQLREQPMGKTGHCSCDRWYLLKL